jgi:hypothetical protein
MGLLGNVLTGIESLIKDLVLLGSTLDETDREKRLRYIQARILYGIAEDLIERSRRDELSQSEAFHWVEEMVREFLDAVSFDAARAQGRAMTLVEGMHFALELTLLE